MTRLRICTVTDGLEAVMRVAQFLAMAREEAERTDIPLATAREALPAALAGQFDLIVIATAADGRSPDMLREVARLALNCGPVIFLNAPTTALPPDLPEGVGILTGPPFAIESISEVLAAALPATAPAPSDAPSSKSAGVEAPSGPQVYVIQPTCGGVGATTVAVNLAAVMAERAKPAENTCAVCLLDLNPQFGSVGTYFDLPENSQLRDAYRNIGRIDAEVFQSCLQYPAPGIAILQTPSEIMPFDALSTHAVGELIAFARAVAPIVLVDMPHCIADWSEQAFIEADRIICVSTLDVRAARNARLIAQLLTVPTLARVAPFHIVNRAPARPSREWKENRTAFETAIGAPLTALLPDGGEAVSASCDAGRPFCQSHPKAPFADAIRSLAEHLPAPPAPSRKG